MKRLIIQLRLSSILLVAACCCTSGIPPVQKHIDEWNTSSQAKESDLVKKSVIDFLQWYKVNVDKANGYKILSKDKSGYYFVDRKASEDYLALMKSSQLLSETYLGYWKTYFDDKRVLIAKEKVKTYIPEGFDFDFVLITDKPNKVRNKIDQLKLKIISMNSKTALIGVRLPSDATIAYEFEMSKGKAGWQIDYISTPNYD